MSCLNRSHCKSLIARNLGKVGILVRGCYVQPDPASPNDLTRALGVITSTLRLGALCLRIVAAQPLKYLPFDNACR
jgi:hypothetical protein